MISRSKPAQYRCATFAVLGSLCLLAGCEEPQPISFAEFMDDDIAREGTLARCNEERDATAADIECANARRAAAAIALREERARREALELESERKLAALRAEVERERAAAREAQLLAEAAARAAYDAQWESRRAAPVGVDGEPLLPGATGDGALGTVPSSQAIGVNGLPIADTAEPAVNSPGLNSAGQNFTEPNAPMPSSGAAADGAGSPGAASSDLQ
jgi:hypothetical protein